MENITRSKPEISTYSSGDQPYIRNIELTVIGADSHDQVAILLDEKKKPKAPWHNIFSFFILLFITPILLSIFYFGFIAADIYISEAKFIVRSANRTDNANFAALIQNQGLARAVDEAYSVNEYLTSRDAADSLEKEINLRVVMSREESDLFNRYPMPFLKDTQERFYNAYRRMIDINFDSSSGITTLKVKAFRASDANMIAHALLDKGEKFINKLNIRANQDTLNFAETLVKDAQRRLNNAQRNITNYRNSKLIVDPQQESSEVLSATGKMATEIAMLEATLSQQLAVAPKSPSIAPLRDKINSLRSQMEKQRSYVVGNTSSIASKLEDYEILVLERELATKSISAATAELEKAQQEAQSQRVYLQTVVGPSLPDQPGLPMRLLGILTTSAISFCIYWIARALINATMDHEI